MLESIRPPRSVNRCRIIRSDRMNFVAVYTVKRSNPDADLSDPELTNVVWHLANRDESDLARRNEMAAIVQAEAADDARLNRVAQASLN